MKIKDEIIIAISKGRILDEGIELLDQVGIKTLESMQDSRKLIYNTNSNKIKLVIVRAADVPTYVGNGAADIGIVGKDTLVEYGSDNIYIPLDLNIFNVAFCSACIKSPILLPPKKAKLLVSIIFLLIFKPNFELLVVIKV